VKPIKLLNPRSSDTNVMGGEPVWKMQPTENRISAMSKAFSWYNYFYGKKDARDMIVNYLESHDRKPDVRALKNIPDSAIRLTTGWLCRMNMVGLELSETEQIKLDNLLKEILTSKQTVEVESEPAPDAPSKPNIQDRLREKVSSVPANLMACLTSLCGWRQNVSRLQTYYGHPWHECGTTNDQSIIATTWKRKLAEFEEVVEGKDAYAG
jgi:hypothetical protein